MESPGQHGENSAAGQNTEYLACQNVSDANLKTFELFFTIRLVMWNNKLLRCGKYHLSGNIPGVGGAT